MTAKYDLSINRGTDYRLWLQYLNDESIPVGLTGYNARMYISRYRGDPIPLLQVDIRGLTYGYTGGITTGFTGSGGIALNTNYDGKPSIGGLLLLIGSKPTRYFNPGKYFYDIEIMIGNGETYSQRLLEGRVNIEGSVR